MKLCNIDKMKWLLVNGKIRYSKSISQQCRKEVKRLLNLDLTVQYWIYRDYLGEAKGKNWYIGPKLDSWKEQEAYIYFLHNDSNYEVYLRNEDDTDINVLCSFEDAETRQKSYLLEISVEEGPKVICLQNIIRESKTMIFEKEGVYEFNINILDAHFKKV